MRWVALALLATPGAASADARAGAAVFKRECAQCHSVRRGESLAGPSLSGIVGRPAGAAPDFAYSAALKGSGLKWTPQTLDGFIAQPRRTVRGILMASPGVADASQRADLIAYLSTLR